MSVPDDDVTVEVDGVSIRKTLNDHQFETLAVVFDIRSGREHTAAVSVTDAIPAGVVEDDVGFHPEYGGEHWQTEGGEVTFSRTFEPGEQYTTVYGVRDFDDDRAGLLAEPSVDVDGAAIAGDVEEIDDLVSESDSDVVKEVIAGERDSLPGMYEDEEEAVAEGGTDAMEAASADAGAAAGAEDDEQAEAVAGTDGETAIVSEDDEPEGAIEPAIGEDATDLAADTEPEATEPSEDATAEPEEADGEPATADTTSDEAAIADVDEPRPGEVASTDEDEAEAEAEDEEESTEDESVVEEADEVTVPVTGGIARVLAKELRAGNVSYEDRRLLREELLPDDGSTDARIQRLQTETADLAAYTEALEEFLDEEGGAEAVLADVERDVEEIDDGLDEVRSGLADVEDAVEGVEETVDGLADDVDDVEADVDGVSGDVRDLSETVEGIGRDVASLEDDVGRLDALGDRIDDVEDDIAAIHDELADLATFRDRLSSVFGPGGGPAEGADEDDEDGADDDEETKYGGY